MSDTEPARPVQQRARRYRFGVFEADAETGELRRQGLRGRLNAQPFQLLHHINYGLAIACMALLVYSPFAQRAVVLMGAGSHEPAN